MSNGPHDLLIRRIVDRTRPSEPSPKLDSTPAGQTIGVRTDLTDDPGDERSVPGLEVEQPGTVVVWLVLVVERPRRRDSTAISRGGGRGGRCGSGERRKACSGSFSLPLAAVRSPVSITSTRGRR